MRAGNSSIYAAAARFFRVPALAQATDAAILQRLMEEHHVLSRPVTLSARFLSETRQPMWVSLKDGGEGLLLPEGLRRYRLYIPDRPTERLRPGEEERFVGDAQMLYRPLPEGPLTGRQFLRFILRGMMPAEIAQCVGMETIATAAGLLLPLFTQWVFTQLIPQGSISLLATAFLLTLLAIVTRNLSSAIRELRVTNLWVNMTTQVEAALVERLLRMPAPFFRQKSASEQTSELHYMQTLSIILVEFLFSGMAHVLFFWAYALQIMRWSVGLGILTLAVVMLQALLSFGMLRSQIRRVTSMVEQSNRNSGLLDAIIRGIRKLKLSGREEAAFCQWRQGFDRQMEYTYRGPFLLRLQSVLLQAVSLGSMLLIYLWAARMEMSAANYMGFIAAYGAAAGLGAVMAGMPLALSNVAAGLRMLAPVLQTNPEQEERLPEIARLRGEICMEKVTFSYAEGMVDVLSNFSLHIRPGEFVAIVGPTGCGKSTVIRLLLGLETPREGRICYDGVDLQTVSKSSVRRQLGVVMQDGKLLLGSLRDNIAVCTSDVDDARIWRAAEAAGIAGDIQNMTMGLNTFINPQQAALSGGQRQRILIARAVLNDPAVLILDEATSALDNATQAQVMEALMAYGSTRIVVAHRLSTIRGADRILVMDQGRIVEEGGFDALLAKNGLFAQLVQNQRLDDSRTAR